MSPSSHSRSDGRANTREAGYTRQIVLLFAAVLLVVLIAVTGIVSRAFHKKQQALAESWFAQGDASLASGHARDARDAYRNALIFEPQNTIYQLHLARALAAFGRSDQSRVYLLNLYNQAPGSGEVNLELARLAAADADRAAAIRHYHGAIYGAWDVDPAAASVQARLELCRFLVHQGDMTQAESELIALAANVPPNREDLLRQTGDLFYRAGDVSRALNEYQRALHDEHNDPETLAGAGRAAYQLGDYARAENYLERAVRDKANGADLVPMLATSRMVVNSDPLAPNLPDRERAHRAAEALSHAISRAAACKKANDIQESSPMITLAEKARQQAASEWSENGLRSKPERILPAMKLVFDLEAEATRECGAPEGLDAALEVIHRTHPDTEAAAAPSGAAHP
jgi:tetratricopeptide (TPR) repeat protein